MNEVWNNWNTGAKYASLLVGAIGGFVCYKFAKSTLNAAVDELAAKAASIKETIAANEEEDEEE